MYHIEFAFNHHLGFNDIDTRFIVIFFDHLLLLIGNNKGMLL